MVTRDTSAEALWWKGAKKHSRKHKKLKLILEGIIGTLNNLQYQRAPAIFPIKEIDGIKTRLWIINPMNTVGYHTYSDGAVADQFNVTQRVMKFRSLGFYRLPLPTFSHAHLWRHQEGFRLRETALCQ